MKRDYLNIGLSLLAGIVIGFLIADNKPSIIANSKAIRESTFNGDSQHGLIDPLLAIESSSKETPTNLVDLQKTIESYVQNEKGDGDIETASVYFQEYGVGSFVTNADENYYPASLMKVPTMIAYYKIGEDNPDYLNKQLYFSGTKDSDSQEHIKSPIQLKPGSYYSVSELVEHMIRYSDNNATDLLIDNLNKTDRYMVLNHLFHDLGVHQVSDISDYLTVKDYSLFFRVLYNATYLNRDFSDKALRLLTETDFAHGIETSVTNNILVAQKFGEFSVVDRSGKLLKRELHNCGIVYYPDHPYLLCVMTKGPDFDKLESFISGVSRMVYQDIEKRY